MPAISKVRCKTPIFHGLRNVNMSHASSRVSDNWRMHEPMTCTCVHTYCTRQPVATCRCFWWCMVPHAAKPTSALQDTTPSVIQPPTRSTSCHTTTEPCAEERAGHTAHHALTSATACHWQCNLSRILSYCALQLSGAHDDKHGVMHLASSSVGMWGKTYGDRAPNLPLT